MASGQWRVKSRQVAELLLNCPGPRDHPSGGARGLVAVGSTPTAGSVGAVLDAGVAQSAEPPPLKRVVEGSTPSASTPKGIRRGAAG